MPSGASGEDNRGVFEETILGGAPPAPSSGPSVEAFTVCKESCDCSSHQHIGGEGELTPVPILEKKKLRASHNNGSVAETGFEPGNLLPVVVLRLSIPLQ